MNRIQRRFDELSEMANDIADSMNTKTEYREPAPSTFGHGAFGGNSRPIERTTYNMNVKLFVQWRTSVLSLLNRALGSGSTTYSEFYDATRENKNNYFGGFGQLHSIFLSAKSDFEGGYLFDVRNLAHASVFTDELEQAKHFLDTGFKVPAAVIAGTVLESTLRELCDQHDELEPADKLNRMNDDLAKVAVYNASRKSQIKAWADIRNSAAHGKPEEFEPSDVARMIDGIRDFVASTLQS